MIAFYLSPQPQASNSRHKDTPASTLVKLLQIAFHTRMGFAPKASETRLADGIPYLADYDGPGEHRVVFAKQL